MDSGVLAYIHSHFLALVIVLQLAAIPQAYDNVTVGLALFATDDNSTWTSQSGDFAFGFRRLPGEADQFLLAIWYAKLPEQTIVWSANRDYQAERESKVELTTTGNLVLSAPSGMELWKSNNTENPGVLHGAMLDTGNFVITNRDSSIIWDSFNEPTDTILPTQVFSVGNNLFSSMSENNYKQGKFQLRFTPINVSNGNMSYSSYNLTLNQVDVYTKNPYGAYYTSPDVSELRLDESGYLHIWNSRSHNTSNLTMSKGIVMRPDSNYYKATLDFDGIFRVYAHPKNVSTGNGRWYEIWYVPENICLSIYDSFGGGPCGYNSICKLGPLGKPDCQCAPGFSLLDVNNRYSGCKQDDVSSMHECNETGSVIAEDRFEFIEMESADWPLTAYEMLQPTTEHECKKSCLRDCYCTVAIFQDPKYTNGRGKCWKKRLPLSNGRFGNSSVERKALFKKLKLKPNRSSQHPKNPNPGGRQQNQVIVILAVLLGTSVLLNFLSLTSISLVGFCLGQGKLPNFYRTLNIRDPEINLHSFAYKDLQEATNGFKEELGRGSFGTVYKGVVMVSGYSKHVAVKRLDKLVREGEREFKTEMTVIGQTHHKNLVRLLGYCDEGEHRLLVYEFMYNGSLSSFLFGVIRPNWQPRMQIASGIARGLMYLHEECSTQIIHCDIKPQNILLDDSFTAKISDFGLAKLLMSQQTRTLTGIRGTKGYVAPEWFRNIAVTVKVDVYSFGVMLLEIICCRRCVEIEMERAAILIEWAYECYSKGEVERLVENDEEALSDLKKVEKLVTVAIWCVQDLPLLRPSMREVSNMIEGIIEVSAPPCPFLYCSMSGSDFQSS
ncbi:G-type lectin S-receptor-like serine/threonine-protein kinase LECRK4 [Corylus avellana]|uniref:G-type lectin S-receptor-like serine/threonine-protein kinase LECRK4 n=1 Tax=Corylus avellana TaxID=13451 RepID=UPI00286B4CE1|nr:G-type lectin S-receptor-like serine/threonine-protein kinase LECRK4 [Corylus avellana]